jgi:hypothetical protein
MRWISFCGEVTKTWSRRGKREIKTLEDHNEEGA